jgi:nuclease S1
MIKRLVFLLLCLFATNHAWAWGKDGHRLIGEQAQRQLNPVALNEVQRLLQREAEPTLAGVSNWADEIRDTDPELGKKTGRWHYVNFSAGNCTYKPKRDCKKGDCLIAALERYSAILKDRKRSDKERNEALKFLVHFVGDVHQPLHNTYKTDRGGNDFQVNINDEGSNLHRVWDSDLIKFSGMNSRADSAWRIHTKTSNPAKPLKPSLITDWSLQACRLIDEKSIYPPSRKLNANYIDQHAPVVDQQLVLSSQHLAGLLNYLLGSP